MIAATPLLQLVAQATSDVTKTKTIAIGHAPIRRPRLIRSI
ncbi:MAG TPA: hypothetical protein VKY22_29750 [Bradyrhizobium sp.]|nr:hypothetical protein [Bradyrhizobium sp.]